MNGQQFISNERLENLHFMNLMDKVFFFMETPHDV